MHKLLGTITTGWVYMTLETAARQDLGVDVIEATVEGSVFVILESKKSKDPS